MENDTISVMLVDDLLHFALHAVGLLAEERHLRIEVHSAVAVAPIERRLDRRVRVGEGVLHRAARRTLHEGAVDHELTEVRAGELGTLVGDLVGTGGSGQHATRGQHLGEPAAVTGGDGDPRAACRQWSHQVRQFVVGDRRAVGADDGFGRALLPYVAGVEEHRGRLGPGV